MNPESTARGGTEIVDEISAWTVGGGIVTFALFPLALPALALIAVLAIPFLLLALAAGLLVAVVAAPILVVRRLWRWATRALPRGTAKRGRQSSGHRASGPRPGTA
jgi:hypothetical protein